MEGQDFSNPRPHMCAGGKPYIAPAILERCHEEFLRQSVQHFRSVKKMGGKDFSQRYQNQLEAELDEAYVKVSKYNDSKNIFYAARTPAKLFAVIVLMVLLYKAILQRVRNP